MVVSAYNNEEGENLFETRFYPDRNLDLPFLYSSWCGEYAVKFYGAHCDEKTQRFDCSHIKFERLHFGVFLKIDSKNSVFTQSYHR